MFTGIVGQMAQVTSIKDAAGIKKFGVKLKKNAETTAIGDSLAINGVCQTITEIEGSTVYFEAIKETLLKTNLSLLKKGDTVNIEFSLTPSDKIGGHFVTGHVDCLGTIRQKRPEGGAIRFEVSAPEKFNIYIAPKGSITIDGVSLTLADCFRDGFAFFCVPHTLKNTTLKAIKLGGKVNIEFDLLAKYVNKKAPKPSSGISIELLQ
ncbi:MAG: riboflavin synthase, partial [Candidatus Omnitrophica bacterium]|nr:riboflavin synthase [Candidatus Omnitrophota bacterium]